MNNARCLSPDTQNLTPAEHATALALAIDTLETVQETIDDQHAATLKAILDDLAYLHYCALESDGPHVNAIGGEA